MNNKKPRLSAKQSQELTKLITITKTATLKAVMDPGELAKVIAVVASDLDQTAEMASAFPLFWDDCAPPAEYYSLDLEWFTASNDKVTPHDVVDMLEYGKTLDKDFITYLECLAELHKRRRKYGMILQHQPLPTMVQVSPSALREYGPDWQPEALASWLTWRKFFYDLDNRSAQETGYLFEPILAAAIGGEPKSAKEAVVKRTGDATKGRQVDCWKYDATTGVSLAYELKLRVTIAASGQGRFAEELSFPADCLSSGATPVLVVLDPTENEKLTALQKAYRDAGGEAYVGDAAWNHLEDEAGATMAKFIERYIRVPVSTISSFEKAVEGDHSRRGLVLLDLSAKLEGNGLTIALGEHERFVERHEDPRLSEDGEPAEE